MTDNSDTESILLFTLGSGDFADAGSVAESILVDRSTQGNVKRSECLELLDRAFDGQPYETKLVVEYRSCSACNSIVNGEHSICFHCRCVACKEWKTKCRCIHRRENRKSIFAWMRRGFITFSKENRKRPPTYNCIICNARLSSLTGPYLRCLECIAETYRRQVSVVQNTS